MPSKIRLALYEPDMPTNTGAMIRLCACLGVGLDIIEPAGFVLDDKKLKRVAMDYTSHLDYKVHASWQHFYNQKQERRLVLLSTKAKQSHYQFQFRDNDTLLLGRESAGVPEAVHQIVERSVLVPMIKDARSLNVGMAAAIVLGEALRQTGGFVL